jgi:ABC-type Fe3+-siderophore transport system permease subunit
VRDGGVRKNAGMTVTRIAWIATVLVALLTALLLLLAGYNGYAGLGLAVAASAGINLL